jgi:hypothetical protein
MRKTQRSQRRGLRHIDSLHPLSVNRIGLLDAKEGAKLQKGSNVMATDMVTRAAEEKPMLPRKNPCYQTTNVGYKWYDNSQHVVPENPPPCKRSFSASALAITLFFSFEPQRKT